MPECRFDDIKRVYNLNSYRRDKEAKKIVQKGFFRKRNVEVIERIREPAVETQVRVTNNLLGMLEGLLDKKPIIPGIRMDELPQILGSSSPSLLISDNEGRRIGGLEYSSRLVGGGYFGSVESYITLTISGEAVSPEQFNRIQTTDALKLKP
ncbi:MAG: hypothetical protein AABX50_02080 [Nanoarchaeota archaeon]